MSEVPQDEDSLADLIGRVADEFLEKLDRGEGPLVEDYVRGHPPTVAEALQHALTDILVMRQPDLSPGTDPPHVLGDFRLIRRVGGGGMGVVYEAEQVSLARRVALKVLPSLVTTGPQSVRFTNEAQAAARLHHTNIVPVYASGVEGGFYFYAMQFINGPTLAWVIKELRKFRKGAPGARSVGHEVQAPAPAAETDVPPEATRSSWVSTLTEQHATRGGDYYRTVARLGIEAAEGLEHAHELGIVHRDIKPGNMLMDERGHLWIADFGLAHFKGQSELTRTGDVIGTALYMSREQALGQRSVDHRTDIYSLGVSLYELLTLERPFNAPTAPEILRKIERDEPPRPRGLNPAIPKELETIVLKAMEKDPKDRFNTARELADDLRRFLDNKPIRAKPPTLVQRVRKWTVRHSTQLRVAGLLTMVSLIGFITLLVWSNRQLNEEKQKALVALSEKQDAVLKLQDALDENVRMTARVASDRGAWRDAVEFTNKALATERYRNSVPLRLDKARALIALNDTTAAQSEIEALLKLPDLGEHKGAVLLLYGDVLMGRDDLKSEQLIKQALAEHLSAADEAYARALLAETTPEAVERLRAALKLNQNLPRAWAFLELLLILQARLGEAREELAKHETIFPNDRNAKVLRAMVIALERDLDGTEKVLTDLSKQAEGAEIQVYRVIVNVLSEFRNPANVINRDTGLPDLARLPAAFAPLLPRLWQFPAGKDNQDVVRAFQQVQTNFPMPLVLRKWLRAIPQAMINLGPFGAEPANLSKLIDDLDRVVTMHPEGTMMYVHALALFGANRFPEARIAAHRAAVTPAIVPIRRQALCIAALSGVMGYTKQNTVLRQQLVDDLRQLLAVGPLRQPHRPELTITLAWVVNEFDLARRLVAEWEQQAPEDLEALYYHIETEMRAGAYGPARELANKYLEKQPGNNKVGDLKNRAEAKIREQAQQLKDAVPVAPAPHPGPRG